MAVQVDPEPELKPLTIDSVVQTLPEVPPVPSDAAIQWSSVPPSVKDVETQTIPAASSEMENQTPRLLAAEVETQTPKPPSLPSDSTDLSMLPVPRSSRRTITLSNASRFTIALGSLPGALYREDSSEDTIIYGRLLYQSDERVEMMETKQGLVLRQKRMQVIPKTREPASEWPPPHHSTTPMNTLTRETRLT